MPRRELQDAAAKVKGLDGGESQKGTLRGGITKGDIGITKALSGCVLESFHSQLQRTLLILHKAGIIHRDIHPDNIYLVISRKPAKPKGNQESWNYHGFGTGDGSFLLAWVLVDCTFSTLMTGSRKSYCRHGTYTPEEQQLGFATAASDLYALGATLYYGITGREIPSFQTRRLHPEALTDYPSGSHASRAFSDHLRELLSLNPKERPRFLGGQEDSIGPGYTGAMRVSETEILFVDQFESDTQILSRKEALKRFLHIAAFEGVRYRGVPYWIQLLMAESVAT